MIDYETIISILNNKFSEKENYTIDDLLNLEEIKKFNSEKVVALIKFLISYDKIHIVNSNNKRFNKYIVRWNKFKDLEELPVKKELKFIDTELCVTLPPFDKFGLSYFLNKNRIKIVELQEIFTSLLKNAKNTIKICSPFLEYSGFEFFKDILLSKARNKVTIEILSRQIKKTEENSRFEDIKRIIELFKSKELGDYLSVRNYYYQTEGKRLASSIHAKLIVIDGYKAYIGSGEIRKNSFDKNFELGVIVSGEKVKEIEMIFDNIFSKSEVITIE